MKFLLGTITMLIANIAMAAVPKISCELNYSRYGTDGSYDMQSISLRVAEPYTSHFTQLGEFKLEASLEPICAADGPCTGKYEIRTVLTKNDVSTFSTKEMKRKHDRHFIQLTVGTEAAFANCDVQ